MTDTALPRLIRLPDVMRITGLARSTIYDLERAGQFPGRVRITPVASAWREDEVRAWIDSRPRARAIEPTAA